MNEEVDPMRHQQQPTMSSSRSTLPAALVEQLLNSMDVRIEAFAICRLGLNSALDSGCPRAEDHLRDDGHLVSVGRGQRATGTAARQYRSDAEDSVSSPREQQGPRTPVRR